MVSAKALSAGNAGYIKNVHVYTYLLNEVLVPQLSLFSWH